MLSMNTNLTEVIFLLDRSGSMSGLEGDTIGGFNSFIKRQRELEGETIVTTVLFDDQVETIWAGMDAAEVNLTEEQYFVRGTTALLDAVGGTILGAGNRLSETSEGDRPGKVIFVITTDGMENSSNEFTYKKVKELIKQQQEKNGWEFIFLGANMDAAKEAGSIGIDRKNAYNFEASNAGIEQMYSIVCEAVTEKRQIKG